METSLRMVQLEPIPAPIMQEEEPEEALNYGFQVSLPDWEDNVKDVNDAVIKYGKLPALLSILQSATNNKIKIEMQRKKIDKRLQH